MLLAIDAGNTNIVFAVFDGDRAMGEWRIATDARRTSDEYAVWLKTLMAMKKIAPDAVRAAIVSSVVPAATFNLVALCRDHFGIDPMRVGAPEVDLGIEVRIANPAEAGADRLLNALAAVERYGAPLMVLDFGTGTTFDVVDADGAFCGGVIAPGPNLALDALHRVAAQLPKVEIRRPPQVIGRGTVEAMQSGMYWGYTGMIEGLIRRIAAELSPTGDPRVAVIATGGLAPVFDRATPLIDHVDPDLTMRGLLMVHKRNMDR